jgi:hypothetical protein
MPLAPLALTAVLATVNAAPTVSLLRTYGSYDFLVRGNLSALMYTPSDTQLVAVQEDRTLRTFDVASAFPVGRFSALNACVVPSLGLAGGPACPAKACTLEAPFTLMGDHAALTANERGIERCDLERRTSAEPERAAAPGPAISAEAVAASPNGDLAWVGNDDGSLVAYSLGEARAPRVFRLHHAPVLALGLAKDGQHVLSVSSDGAAIQSRQGTLVSTLQLLPKGKGSCPERLVTAAVSDDATRVAAVSTSGALSSTCLNPTWHLRLWDVAHGKLLWDVPDSPITKVAFSHSGHELAVALPTHPEEGEDHGEGMVVRLEAKSGTPVDARGHHRSPVTALRLSKDGAWLAVGDQTGALYIWDARSGEPKGVSVGKGQAITALAFGPDNHALLVQGEDDQTRLYEAPSATPGKVVIPAPVQDFDAACRPPAPRVLATPAKSAPGQRGPLTVQDPDELPVNQTFPDELRWLDDRQILAPVAEESCVALEGTCNYGCDRTYTLERVATATAKVLQRFPSLDEPLLGSCGKRGDLILTQAAGGGLHAFGPDGRLAFGFGAELGKVISCDTSADGRRILLATRNAYAVVDGRTFAPLGRPRHRSPGGQMALSPDGARALEVSGSRVRLISLSAGEVIKTLPLEPYEDVPTQVAFGTGGDTFFVGTARGVVLQFAVSSARAQNP